ncbi:hypothetical protein QX776_12460 [Alteromonadaceae bacterium BrNp21-10]|nr:hypothetical protein [Alteromonadaceae bacterium BrNp21-10]
MKIISTTCLYQQSPHSAFSDLCAFHDEIYCCFRIAENHISGDGQICILQLDWQGHVMNKIILRQPRTDLRDPKLSITADGKLLLLAYARQVDENGKFAFSQPQVWFSNNGQSWSAKKDIGQRNWWLWRLRWQDDVALGFAYNRRSQTLDLYAGNPLRTFEKQVPAVLSLQKHQLGYPNESDIAFDSQKTAYAIVRRDADTCTAQLGIAKPPYKQWCWHDLGAYLGAPCMLMLDDSTVIICARIWRPQGPQTALLKLDLPSKKLTLETVLPSAGDCSYAGMVMKDGFLYVSYYSSHVGGKSMMYLSTLTL